jgi:uncharacterized protein (TIGR02996 family)
MRNADLEAAILAAPHDPQAYLVYADWLQSQGDPRGELIVLQHEDRDLANAHLDKHRETFLGRFATQTPETFDLEWRFGYIQSATIGWEIFSGENEDDPSSKQLADFLRLESARFLETLSLGPTAHEDELMLEELAGAIEETKPIMLRRLHLGDTSDWDISGTYTRMPNSESIRGMRDLTLRGGSVTLSDDIDLPELVSFTVETGGLGAHEITQIANAKWPKLESLEIWFGDPNYGASGGIEQLAPILEGRGLANLRSLGLRNCPFADELVGALAGSNILKQIHTLDLSMGNLSDAGLQTMLDVKDRFGHLQRLVLDDNALTNALEGQAGLLAKVVMFGADHTPDRAVNIEGRRYRRFVSVGE